MEGTNSEDPLLRAKYLDWCSARIADRFLALSPDEIYQLAERAHVGQASWAGPQALLSPVSAADPSQPDWRAAINYAAAAVASSDVDSDEALSFRALVARVTRVLADDMDLPTFEEWGAAYSEAPDEFDPVMLGFWKEEL